MACREYLLPRDEISSEPKGWTRRSTKIGSVLEVTTWYPQGKYGVEIRIKSVNKDNSHSWVRISHDNEQETSEMQFEDCALKSNVRAFASRSKTKAKPQRRIFAISSTIVYIGERTWTDIEPQDYSSVDYPVSKQLITLLRHGSQPREDDGAVEFWRLKDHLRKHFVHYQHWSDEKWKSTMAKGGGNKKKINIVHILQEKFVTSELFKVIQDAISLILHYRTMF